MIETAESLAEQSLKEALWKSNYYTRIINELETGVHYQEFFKQYSSSFVVDFIKNYAFKKVYWHLYGEKNLQSQKEEKNQWSRASRFCLELILQKKLFDLQCQWRGNRIKFPGIELTSQFKWWSDHIFSCPFLEPVNEIEVGYFIRFLQESDLGYRFQESVEWQNFKAIKDEFLATPSGRSNCYYNTWYEFHNQQTGNDIYFALNDERGTLEQYYLQLGEQEETRERNIHPPDSRPRLEYSDEKMLEYFSSHFDSKESHRKYLEKKNWHSPFNRIKTALIEEDLLFLERQKESVPIESHEDWRVAIFRAAELFRRNKTLEKLPIVAEDYWAFLKSGKPFSGEKRLSGTRDLESDLLRQKILLGRKRIGEQENLDF
jgi:hypothetical protein